MHAGTAGFWHDTAELPPLPLPTDYPRPAERAVGNVYVSADNSLTAALRKRRHQNVNVFVDTYGVATLLYRYMNVNGEASDCHRRAVSGRATGNRANRFYRQHCQCVVNLPIAKKIVFRCKVTADTQQCCKLEQRLPLDVR